MRDILKMIRFDYLTVRQIALLLMLSLYTVMFILASSYSPMIVIFSSFGVFLLMVTLHSAEDGAGLNKLYGILPVRMKNIVRGRFCFLILLCLITEAVQLISLECACSLRLYRFFLNGESANYQLIENTFNQTVGQISFMPVILFCGCCIILGFLEMIGMLYDRENQIKSILILLGIAGGLLFVIGILKMQGVIPEIDWDAVMAFITEKQMLLAVCGNIVSILLCLLFCEISAKQLENREL